MKRRSLVIPVAVLAATLILSACGKTQTVESAAPSVDPTPTAKNEYPLIVNAGSTVEVDLNGDGKQDEVNFVPSEDAATIFHLSVNGNDYTESVYVQGLYTDSLESAYYCITDIDSSDNMLEIAIMDYGPSDDCITDFFRYDGTELRYIGRVSGLIVSSYSDESDLIFNGDGTIGSYVRLSVLQTWYSNVNWRISKSGGFELVAQDLYYPDSSNGCDVTSLVEISAYSSNDTSSEKTALPAGTALTIIATDNKNWVLAEASDGKQRWIHLDSEYGQSVETPEGYVIASEVFSGLIFAD